MKTFTYNCPDCGQGGSVNTSEVESTEAAETDAAPGSGNYRDPVF